MTTDFVLDPKASYAFCPAYQPAELPQQIRIVFQGHIGAVPTALVAIDLDQAEQLCDRLNARLGLSRDDWLAILAQSMASNPPAPTTLQ